MDAGTKMFLLAGGGGLLAWLVRAAFMKFTNFRKAEATDDFPPGADGDGGSGTDGHH